MDFEIALIALLSAGFFIAICYFLCIFDELKERIDRVVQHNRWQNEELERLKERISKLEKK